MHRIVGVSDPINKILIWSYPGSGSVAGTPNKLIMFNYQTQQWSNADQSCEFLNRTLSTGYTLEGLDALGYTMETLPYSLDSRAWTGGNPILSGYTTAHKLGYFNGDNLAATIETGEFPQAQEIMYVDGIRPLIDGGTVTASVGYRASPSANVTYTTATSAGDDGVCPQRIAARFCRAKVSIAAAGSWTDALGIEPRMTPDGER